MICHAHDTIKDKAVWDRFMSVFGKLDATDDEIEVARRILKDCGSYDYAIEMADRYTNEAIDSLNCLKESDDKEFMIELAKFSMARDV
jgi:geranylgeranyl pyrophosphate synthase